jgi:excisionase family DNA binding protein
MEKTHYKVKEVAPILGLSEYAMRDWCREGVIKAVKVRRNWLIAKSEVERLLKVGI